MPPEARVFRAAPAVPRQPPAETRYAHERGRPSGAMRRDAACSAPFFELVARRRCAWLDTFSPAPATAPPALHLLRKRLLAGTSDGRVPGLLDGLRRPAFSMHLLDRRGRRFFPFGLEPLLTLRASPACTLCRERATFSTAEARRLGGRTGCGLCACDNRQLAGQARVRFQHSSAQSSSDGS